MQQFVELADDKQWREALTILKHLRPDLEIEQALRNRASLKARGYKMFGMIENGAMVCMAGIVVHPHITRGSDFWVHDLVTAPQARSQGLGQLMMRFLEKQASTFGCSRLMVHTRLENERAQNFYEKHLEYDNSATIFQKELFQKELPQKELK